MFHKYKLWSICLLVVFSHQVWAQYAGGTGDPCDPFQIATAEQLNHIGSDPCMWNKHFILIDDIDLSQYDGREGRPAFNIIAPDTDPCEVGFQGTGFSGSFDGNGHEIGDLTIDGDDYLGLFGMIGHRDANVSNLHLKDVTIHGNWILGGLAGRLNSGTIQECSVTGILTGDRLMGGLIGTNYRGVVTHSRTEITINTSSDVGGGICGSNGSTITNCSSIVDITGWSYIGGLVGLNLEGSIKACYSMGEVDGDYNIGGLVGKWIIRCYV